jgi:hypothetical protein
MMGRYDSPAKHSAAHHEYCRVVPLSGGGTKVSCSASGNKRTTSPEKSAQKTSAGKRESPNRTSSKKRGIAEKIRAAFSRKRPDGAKPLPPVRVEVERKSGAKSGGIPGAPASVRVTEKNVGRAQHLADRSPGKLISRTVETLEKSGFGMYPAAIGKGSYGTVFRGELRNPTSFRTFSKSSGFVHRTGSADDLREGDDLAIKIQVVRSASELGDLERESRVHQHVTKFSRDLAPVFHVAGFVPENWTYVTVTSLVKGGSLCPVAERRLTATGFRKIEKAVMNLWGIGVLHGDLHCKNIMIDSGGNVKIIDFGRAVMIPKNMRPKKISEALDRGFQTRLQGYGNDAVRKRVQRGNSNYFVIDKKDGWKVLDDKFQYSDDVQALRVLWKKLPDSEKKKFEVRIERGTSSKKP